MPRKRTRTNVTRGSRMRPRALGGVGGHAAAGAGPVGGAAARAAAGAGAGAGITRRRFLLGAAGVAGVAAVAGAGVAVVRANRDVTVESLSVPEDAVFSLDDCDELERDGCFDLVGSYELPFGSLLHSSDDELAVVLVPSEVPSPLVTVSALRLASGDVQPLLSAAAGADEGFEVLDARGSASGLCWVEENVFEGTWRVLCASLLDDGLSEPRVVDEGDASTQAPTLAVVGTRAFWDVTPTVQAAAEAGSAAKSLLRTSALSSGGVDTLHEAPGRIPCPIYAAGDGVVAAMRHPQNSRCVQLLHIGADSGQMTSMVTLPAGMTPQVVGWGATGFSFGFEGIYSYGDGIANLGTYTPAQAGSGYFDVPWFRFNATPLAQPAWCGSRWFMVKHARSVYAVDPESRTCCSLGTVSGCTSWGDYLCSSGTRTRLVTASHLDQTTTEGVTERTCIVRVWEAAASGAEGGAAGDGSSEDSTTNDAFLL